MENSIIGQRKIMRTKLILNLALLKLIVDCKNHEELKFWLKRMENNNENDKKL